MSEPDTRSWADGFRSGQESIKRKNESGCCCKISEDGNTIESACMLHIEWKDEAYESAAQVADGFTCGGCGMDGKCSKAIRALKSAAPTNETGNARMGGE